MRRRWAVFALLASTMVGCLPARQDSAGVVSESRRAYSGPTGSDVVQLQIAVVERPFGDRYLNSALWELADEQAVGLERKATLDDNGFRVGLVGGIIPADLLAMLTSERSCANPHLTRTRAGSATQVVIGPAWTHCNYRIWQGDQATTVDINLAQCQLEVVATPADAGKTTLRFTPIVKHGESRFEPRPVRDPSGEHRWEMRDNHPVESYTALAWEVTVAPNEYIVVGTRLDSDDTLGNSCFLNTESPARLQRLLVVRAGRALADGVGNEGNLGAPPVALQAGWISARGIAP